jgi:hypothetical protein
MQNLMPLLLSYLVSFSITVASGIVETVGSRKSFFVVCRLRLLCLMKSKSGGDE